MPSPSNIAFLRGGGDVSRLIGEMDWSDSPIGDPQGWPELLQTTAALILNSRFAQAIVWGPERATLYNDAFVPILGTRHNALGRPFDEIWASVWDEIGPMCDAAYAGEAVFTENFPLVIERQGQPEQVYFTSCYSPIRDRDGQVMGMIDTVVETTATVHALEESETQFRTLAEAMPNMVWMASAQGEVEWCNAWTYSFTGIEPGALDAQLWLDLMHPDDRENAREDWLQAVARGELYSMEYRLRGADGRYRWHLTRSVPTHLPDGTVSGWIGTGTDIDAQKRAESVIERDRNRMWTMMQDLLLVCDMTGRITDVNPSATRLLGWAPNEMVGNLVTDFIHPDDIERSLQEVAKIGRGFPTFAFENRYRMRSGEYRVLHWTAMPDGDRIHAIGRDVTDARSIERDQARIWALSPVLKLVAEPDGAILKVNPAWTQALGWDERSAAERNFLDFVSPGDRAAAAAALDRLRTDAMREELELSLDANNGPPRRIAWNFVAEHGQLFGFGRDVTEQRSAEDALRQSQKMEAVGQLTGGIAHDFNNLLQGISGNLELLRLRIDQGRMEGLDRFIAGAASSASRAAALTHRLLAFSRRQPLDPRPVKSNPLIHSIEDMLRRTLGETIRLELDLPRDLWLTRCDPNQLESAILNLAINARDAMPDGGTLVIRSANATIDPGQANRVGDARPGPYVCISVADTGTGMDADVAARAFEPFFTTKPIGQGTGLGLSMIYGFARQSEGFAAIESAPGVGTTVRLFLPRFVGEASSDEAAAQLSEDHATHAAERILVVEDDTIVRGLIVEVLGELGYRAIEAPDGPAGVEALASDEPIDLLVTDIGLPGLNGRQVADIARKDRPDLKILFMTGYAENAAMASGFLERGMEMITKPFAMEALATRVRAMIEGA